MTKTLQEIQQENRRLIIKACNPSFDPDRFDYPAYQIRLNKVLLAFNQTKELFLYFDICEPAICERAPDIYDYDNFNIISNWDLNKETLEDQEESVQRAVYQLFKG